MAETESGRSRSLKLLLGLASAVTVGFVLLAALAPRVSSDLWWGLAAGRYLVETGSLARIDPFSATASGMFWVNPEWLAHALAYRLYETNETLLGLYRVALVVTLFSVGWMAVRTRVRPLPALFTLALAAWVCLPYLDGRPHLWTLLLVGVFLLALDRYRDGPGRFVLWLVPLQILWVNVHGGYPLGPLLVLGAIIVELVEGLRRTRPLRTAVLRRLVLLGIALVLALLVNPWTTGALVEPFRILFAQDEGSYRQVTEWLPPPFLRDAPLAPVQFWLLLAVTALCVSLAARKRWRSLDLLAAGASSVFLLMALRHRRFIPLFAVACIPLLAPALALALDSAKAALRSRPWAQGVFGPAALTVWLMLGVALLVEAKGQLRTYVNPAPTETSFFRILTSHHRQPESAVRFLADADLFGPVFNAYSWGGYLLFARPTERVFIDGRAQQVYPASILDRYVSISGANPGWSEEFDQLGIDHVLLQEDRNGALLRALLASPDWSWVYSDARARVFIRSGSRPDLVQRLGEGTLPMEETGNACVVYANAAMKRGDTGAAIRYMERAVELEPDDARFRVMLENLRPRGDAEGS